MPVSLFNHYFCIFLIKSTINTIFFNILATKYIKQSDHSQQLISITTSFTDKVTYIHVSYNLKIKQ